MSKSHINKAQQEAINRLKQKRDKVFNVDEVLANLKAGNRTTLSQAITLIESNNPQQQATGQQILNSCMSLTGNSIRIGITGVPGVGKSTFIESFGQTLIALGKKVAVLAIDPSSQKTGGSILGDKTRMEKLSSNPNAFIRPSASAESLGGVAQKTRESILLCEAAGYDVILVETVGVGQSETEVHSMVDFFLLLMLAGAGDELQGIKRGIMEMADLIAITKADNDNEHKAKLAIREYKNALHLFPPAASGWYPTVLSCSSLTNNGIQEIWEVIEKHEEHFLIKGLKENNRKQQAKYWMKTTIQQMLHSYFKESKVVKEAYQQKEQQVINQLLNPFTAAQELLEIFLKSK
jgi:LAO/AO transport system kinase